MRCPLCMFEGEPVRGRCMRCGYAFIASPAQATGSPIPSPGVGVKVPYGPRLFAQATQSPLPPRPMTGQQYFSSSSVAPSTPLPPLMRGDVLQKGRYHLLAPMAVPQNQQNQGKAWAAVDLSNQHHPIIVREVIFPAEVVRVYPNKEQALRSMEQRLAAVGRVSNLPKVVDAFSEREMLFLVFLRPEGVALSTYLAQYGGALPERVIAEYGWQLCDMLGELAAQTPPLIHGSISPETIIVSLDGSEVSLIHLPLFPPQEAQTPANKPSSAYIAPERARHVASPSSDLYSVAAVMHHAVTGYDPEERMAFFFPPARRLNPAVSQRMEAILSRQLHLTVTYRYANPQEMQRELTELIESTPEAEATVEPVAKPEINSMLLSVEELRELRNSAVLLDTGVIAAIGVLLLIVILFILLHP